MHLSANSNDWQTSSNQTRVKVQADLMIGASQACKSFILLANRDSV